MREITQEEALAGLDAAVLARVAEVSGWAPGRLAAEAERCGDVIACGGDAILRESLPKRAAGRGPTPAAMTSEQLRDGVIARDFTRAELRDALTTGLAIGALVPGGVTWMGIHYCTAQHPDCAASDVTAATGGAP
jgi:hypothetical protein